MITSSEYCRTSSTMITSSLLLPAKTDITLLPACLRAVRMGSIAAMPIPPPAHTTVPYFSMREGVPKGPTISTISSPTFSWQSFVEERPTSWITIVNVPFWASALAMVYGTLSLWWSTRTMIKLPGRQLRAMSGASTSIQNTFSENCFLLIILFIV